MVASLKAQEYKRRSTAYRDRKIRERRFSPGELVLRRTEGGKLDPKWEGPVIVRSEVAKGAYKLKNSNGAKLRKIWNAEHLKKFYP